MIGTLICRNCDTVFEVSEGDVTKFKVHPVFTCSVCSSDLSPLMAGFVNGQGTKRDPEDEFTIPEDAEVFDGLPMGETFDQAAEKIRAGGPPGFEGTPLITGPEPTPITRSPEPTPISRSIALAEATPLMTPLEGEDPLTMALRIASQAAALAATSPGATAAGRDGEEAPTGVIQWKPAAATAAPVKAMASASPAASAAPAAAAKADPRSTEIGVVPEEPENESTLRGLGASTTTESVEASVVEPTEPTHPSTHREETPLVEREGTPHEEATPLLAAMRATDPDDDIIPDVRDDQPVAPAPVAAARNPITPEATPAMRAVPPTFTEAPREEVTIRKSSPPPGLSVVRPLIVRSGNGPAGVGALGIRVVVGRPIVRPAFNGRAPATHSDTAISASNPIPRFEPVRSPSTGTRNPAPPPPSTVPGLGGATTRAAADEAVPPANTAKLVMVGGAAFFGIGILVLIVWLVFFHHPVATVGETPTPAETSVAVASLAPPPTTATTPEATPTVVHATPTPRNALSTFAPTSTPRPALTQAAVAPTPRATISPTSTTLVALPSPAATKLAAATPIPTPKLANPATTRTQMLERSKTAIETFNQEGGYSSPTAVDHLMHAVKVDQANEDLLINAFLRFSPHADTHKQAREVARFYQALSNAPSDRKTSVDNWLLKNPGP